MKVGGCFPVERGGVVDYDGLGVHLEVVARNYGPPKVFQWAAHGEGYSSRWRRGLQ